MACQHKLLTGFGPLGPSRLSSSPARQTQPQCHGRN